jgi:hypothetical protein
LRVLVAAVAVRIPLREQARPVVRVVVEAITQPAARERNQATAEHPRRVGVLVVVAQVPTVTQTVSEVLDLVPQ